MPNTPRSAFAAWCDPLPAIVFGWRPFKAALPHASVIFAKLDGYHSSSWMRASHVPECQHKKVHSLALAEQQCQEDRLWAGRGGGSRVLSTAACMHEFAFELDFRVPALATRTRCDVLKKIKGGRTTCGGEVRDPMWPVFD